MKHVWKKIRLIAVDWMMRWSGVSITPRHGVWGVVGESEEQRVLKALYANDEWKALMRIYAEREAMLVLSAVSTNEDYWTHRGKFLAYNSMLLNARRAFMKKDNEGSNRTDQ